MLHENHTGVESVKQQAKEFYAYISGIKTKIIASVAENKIRITRSAVNYVMIKQIISELDDLIKNLREEL